LNEGSKINGVYLSLLFLNG